MLFSKHNPWLVFDIQDENMTLVNNQIMEMLMIDRNNFPLNQQIVKQKKNGSQHQLTLMMMRMKRKKMNWMMVKRKKMKVRTAIMYSMMLTRKCNVRILPGALIERIKNSLVALKIRRYLFVSLEMILGLMVMIAMAKMNPVIVTIKNEVITKKKDVERKKQ